jgi:hypothetical protein
MPEERLDHRHAHKAEVAAGSILFNGFPGAGTEFLFGGFYVGALARWGEKGIFLVERWCDLRSGRKDKIPLPPPLGGTLPKGEGLELFPITVYHISLQQKINTPTKNTAPVFDIPPKKEAAGSCSARCYIAVGCCGVIMDMLW